MMEIYQLLMPLKFRVASNFHNLIKLKMIFKLINNNNQVLLNKKHKILN